MRTTPAIKKPTWPRLISSEISVSTKLTPMMIHILDDNEVIIGSAEIVCKKWTLTAEGFVNDEAINIEVTTPGKPTKLQIFTAGVLTQTGPFKCEDDEFVGLGQTLRMSRGNLRIMFESLVG